MRGGRGMEPENGAKGVRLLRTTGRGLVPPFEHSDFRATTVKTTLKGAEKAANRACECHTKPCLLQGACAHTAWGATAAVGARQDGHGHRAAPELLRRHRELDAAGGRLQPQEPQRLGPGEGQEHHRALKGDLEGPARRGLPLEAAFKGPRRAAFICVNWT